MNLFDPVCIKDADVKCASENTEFFLTGNQFGKKKGSLIAKPRVLSKVILPKIVNWTIDLTVFYEG